MFADAAGLRLSLHPTSCGRIPVILASHRADFEALVQALTRRNEPDPIPRTMGACMVAGYNNWDRIGRVRAAWYAQHGADAERTWPAAFERLAADKTLYQDRFVLLSDGPYSATPAAALGLDEQRWIAMSRVIRLEHECTHYFTRRVFGSMNNRLFDELLADYMGIVHATGRFPADWLLRFMGFDARGCYRPGSRLETYRGTPPLSDGAFAILQRAVVQATAHLQRFDAIVATDYSAPMFRTAVVLTLAQVRLEQLVDDGAPSQLAKAFARLCPEAATGVCTKDRAVRATA
jgi:hypothetical protein